MHIRTYIGTLCGIGVGVLAVVIWMATFQPHAGVELSGYLFPLSAFILKRLYPIQSIPVLLWYGGALVQWIVFGAVLDVLRRVFRRESRHDMEAQPSAAADSARHRGLQSVSPVGRAPEMKLLHIIAAGWLGFGVSALLIVWQLAAYLNGRIPNHILPFVLLLSGTEEAVPVAYSWTLMIGALSALTCLGSLITLICAHLILRRTRNAKSSNKHGDSA
ncbi:MAG: hypothetical protein H7A55_18375 [Verrucomicrobiaceae bacterium]|nr:hypothetical protein [Verrucomicrobiaceae bacterium]